MHLVDSNFKKVVELLKFEKQNELLNTLKLFDKDEELTTIYSILLDELKNFKEEDNKSKTIRFIMEDVINILNHQSTSENIACKEREDCKKLIAEILMDFNHIKYGKFELCKDIINIMQDKFNETDRMGIYEEIFMNLDSLDNDEKSIITERISNISEKFQDKKNVNQIKVLKLGNIYHNIASVYLEKLSNTLDRISKQKKTYLLDSLKIFNMINNDIDTLNDNLSLRCA